MSRKSLFPPYPLDESLAIAQTMWEHNGGNPTRRVTIFHILKRQPDSGPSRSLVTASSGYGLTEGGFTAELLKLTDRGRSIVADQNHQAKLDAVLQVDIFRNFFERYRDAIVPSQTTAIDFLKEHGISAERASSCLNTILRNGRLVGLIREYSGKERIISPEHAFEDYTKMNGEATNGTPPAAIDEAHGGIGNGAHSESKTSHAPVAEHATTTIRNGQCPNLHVDVQIHISADAKPEQIEQIFASMAKHLYNRD